ncbi:MAG TPA: Tim44-like domain-containing protein [Candidatus Wallbacteria bacterium]|nr:Tim44-like domain-containing protein [Candidatus Wallbacteria bacterium]
MNKRKSFLNFIIFSFLTAILTLSLSAEVFARAGRSGGSSGRSYSSSRSYSSGSYSSGGYGRSSSYGSSYGSGYGSSYGGGYRRSYGSGYGSSYYYGRGGSGISIIIFIVIAVGAIALYIILKIRDNSYNSGDYSSGGQYGSGNSFGSGGSYGSSYGSGVSGFSGGGYGYGRGSIQNPEAEARVRHVFNMVQRAWAERDQYIASDCMSERMFREHKAETDEMISERKKNILENIVINEIAITKFSDNASSGYDGGLEPASAYGSGGASVMVARITASMIDYVIDETSGSLIDGDANVPDRFTETWRFIKNEHGWVLDEIE